MAEIRSGVGKDGFQVVHDLVCFSVHIGGFDISIKGVYGDLAGYKEQVAGLYRLVIGSDGGRGIGGIDDLFFHAPKIAILVAIFAA